MLDWHDGWSQGPLSAAVLGHRGGTLRTGWLSGSWRLLERLGVAPLLEKAPAKTSAGPRAEWWLSGGKGAPFGGLSITVFYRAGVFKCLNIQVHTETLKFK